MVPPMWIFTSASHIDSAWASVLTAMNSTPAHAGVDHAVDGVGAAAADADDLDDRQVVARLHRNPPIGTAHAVIQESLDPWSRLRSGDSRPDPPG